MKSAKYFMTFLMLVCTYANAVTVLPPRGGFRSDEDREDFNYYQNYNHQQRTRELLEEQLRIQQESLRLQREASRGW